SHSLSWLLRFFCFLSPLCFFFSSRRRHTRSKRDWSSDVCSSDLSYLLKRVCSPCFSDLIMLDLALFCILLILLVADSAWAQKKRGRGRKGNKGSDQCHQKE